MISTDIQQMADRLAALMEERLAVRGSGLSEKLRKGGHLLPRRIRAEAMLLAEAAQLSANPKLYARLDHERLSQAFDACLRHLQKTGRWERYWLIVLRLLGSIAFNLLLLAALIVAILVWRGLV